MTTTTLVLARTHPLRTALLVVTAGLFALLLGALFSLFASDLRTASAAGKLPWYLARASGVIAYVFLVGTTAWGLLLSTRLVKTHVPPPLTLALHNSFTWLALGFAVFHGAILLFDHYIGFTPAQLLVPFTSPYEPVWVGLGTIGLYLAVLTAFSFYVRRWIGQRTWRRLHYLTFAVFVLITVHGWSAGTDASALAAIYLAAGAGVMFLTLYRVLDAMTTQG